MLGAILLTVCSRTRARVTSILISHFLISLRGADISGRSATSSLHLSRFSTFQFGDSFVGNLGAPLEFGEKCTSSNSSSVPEGEDDRVVSISHGLPMEYFHSSSDDTSEAATEGNIASSKP